uniref:Phosphate transport system permease protein n=1 Tax=uncultured bacterium contig00023 TaxID=1181512 RepID=A0A806KD81_9BACT|nr:phosphate transport system permease protein PstC (TC 3.A.1.7.1) [uncultured bacterium contig00023]
MNLVDARKFTDIFFKHLFSIVALFSALALGAILIFVFAQGTMPFFTPTASGIRLVAQRIDDLTVNGKQYIDHSTFIEIPKNTESISIRFPSGGSDAILDILVNAKEKDPEKILTISSNTDVKITNPESYVYTVSWPAAIAALEKRIHILVPEPPYSLPKFLSGLDWRPSRDKVYGIFPMIAGTLMASFGAILLGVPVAILCALFMAEFLKPKPASVVRAGVELLAGIPSVVYGFFGLMVIVPFVKNTFNIPSGNTLLSAIIVLALMILPTVITIAETSLRAVPLAVREASLSLGASKMQTSWMVVLPHANSGVIAGVILGISRAVGETMAVILVAGNSPHLTFNPLASVRTLTSTIAMEMGYAAGRHSEMLFSIGVTLFTIILILNSMILWFRRKMEVEL